MNKWEKEVHESLLDSEEEALKELEKQYNQALNDINQKIKLFQSDIDLLDEAMNTEGMTDAAKDVLLSQKRSKIYQKQFQEALQGQISGILDNMHGKNYSTIEGYLKQSYEDGYIGTMYDLAQQGIPVITPIDQAAATKAILTDSKVSKGLYNALGVDVGKLKKTISQEISRGISTSLSYSEIARNIANASKAPLSRAMTITRTEGHRIQNTASRDSANEAKAHGADLVKIWDSTLDGKTRDSHRMVDGQVRELDEKFSNGLDRPGDPSGGASEVINCRCVEIHKPRWALEDGFVKMDNFTGELRTFESPKDYEDFKEKYWSKENQEYMKYVQDLETKYGTNNFEKLLGSMSDREYQRFSELESASPMFKSISKSVSIPEDLKYVLRAETNFDGKDIDVNVLRIIDESIASRKAVQSDFFFDEIKVAKFPPGDKSVFITNYVVNGGKSKTNLYLNTEYFTGTTIEQLNEMCYNYYKNGWWKSQSVADLVNHEIMHARINYYNTIEKASRLYDELRFDERVKGFCRLVDNDPSEFLNEVYVSLCNGEEVDGKYIDVFNEYVNEFLGG